MRKITLNEGSPRARIRSLLVLILGLLLIQLTACGGQGNPGSSDPLRFYVGSGGNLEYSIFLCELDPVAGVFSVVDSFAGASGSGYLDLSPDGTTLYATSRDKADGEEGHNSVTAFTVNQSDFSLTLLNSQSSQGRGNCHVQVSPKGDYLFAANYSSGHATALPLEADGRVAPASSVVRGEGSGPVESRQKGPHAHQVMMDPEGKFLLVPDLGTDKVMNYILDAKSGELTPNPDQPWLSMEPGSGPRHLVFHPSGEFVFILSELNSTITACRFNSTTGVLSIINSASIVKDDFTGAKQAAAIRIHPNGKYLYASNRDDVSSVAVLGIDEQGEINRLQVVDNVPYWPRDFNITPDGNHLLVAGGRANEIGLYIVDPATGLLTGTETKVNLPGPICTEFIE